LPRFSSSFTFIVCRISSLPFLLTSRADALPCAQPKSRSEFYWSSNHVRRISEFENTADYSGERMRCLTRAIWTAVLLAGIFQSTLLAQTALTWEQIRGRFEAANPTLKAGAVGIEESRAEEITAYLRPNPDFTLSGDQIDPFSFHPFRPFYNALPFGSFSYLHERQHKRELRLESAQQGTAISVSGQADLERNLVFTLRTAFIQTLQAKAVLALSRESLAYYDHVLQISRERLKAGDIAQVDMDRLDLQRVQYQSDVQTAEVNLRTAKIQLLTLLNDRTPVQQFDVSGPFDFTDQVSTLDEMRQTALNTRPDLKQAMQSVEKARTDHQLAVANGSTDPTFGLDAGRNPPLDHYIGLSVSIPLRIFDRNQGEKLRTQLDINRNQRLREATEAQVYSDVDSAYATVDSTLTLLRPYKTSYLAQAAKVRETVTFAYQHGGASLLDFLSAQSDYRNIQLSYLNLVGSYLAAANQLNLAVGREVIP
jgi:outer membrane protein, heavy metal efflux system